VRGFTFVLHVEMQIKAGRNSAFEQTFIDTFRPAISQQEAFRGVELMRPIEEGDYRLSITFDTQCRAGLKS
jgi:heme-degrading monooxygenase HmoA